MSIEKATEASAAEMLSTMEVRVRMFPCSGESAALKRSAGERESESTRERNNRCCLYIGRCVKRATHPRCCSSACTARGCCSTPGYCSRCCQSWARWMTTPVTMEMHTHTHTQKLLSFIRGKEAAHPTPCYAAHQVSNVHQVPQPKQASPTENILILYLVESQFFF